MSFDPTSLIKAVFSVPIISNLWWLWLFLILFFLARSLWLSYVQQMYKLNVDWTLFELKVPRELSKSPKAMEQIFMSVHAIRNTPNNVKEKWWDGEVTLWFSFEIVSFGGELHLYARVPKKHRNMVEAALYAQYSDLEVAEVKEDYIERLPPTIRGLKDKGYDLFGNELILAKHDAYPIRTYVDFEEIEEERQLDPIAALLETIAKIKPQETIWVQIIVRPTDESWKEEGEKLVNYLREKTGRQRIQTQGGAFIWIERTPGELEVMKAIERSLSKPGFHTIVRYIYTSPKEIMDTGFARRGVYSAFNQYASESLNKFKHNTKAWTRVNFWFWPHLFPKRRLRARQVRIYEKYRKRHIYEEALISKVLRMRFFDWGLGAEKKKIVLNAEELATIFHPPTNVVLTGPLIKRVESRKIGPPAGLSIYGGEGEGLPGVKKNGK